MGGKMFNNLIESSSHAREFKRRGSFILFTSVTYLLLFTIAGVLSIYAYDARMDDQNAVYITMLSPVDLASFKPLATSHAPAPMGNNNGHAFAVRENPTARVDQPNIAPTAISATPNTNPPLPPGIPYIVGAGNSNPGIAEGPGNLGSGGGSEISGGRMPAIKIEPPPAPIQKPVPRLVSKGVITSQAISLPKPFYPPLARQTRTQGVVSVQVLIDETGKVISAKTVSGHPLLAAAAQKAAYEARFSPTMLGDHPVKVSGVITYNFVLQ
jgi:periplasmic protein TonB